jgi:hypothetical protein
MPNNFPFINPKHYNLAREIINFSLDNHTPRDQRPVSQIADSPRWKTIEENVMKLNLPDWEIDSVGMAAYDLYFNE